MAIEIGWFLTIKMHQPNAGDYWPLPFAKIILGTTNNRTVPIRFGHYTCVPHLELNVERSAETVCDGKVDSAYLSLDEPFRVCSCDVEGNQVAYMIFRFTAQAQKRKLAASCAAT
jgi:hypothetical protein